MAIDPNSPTWQAVKARAEARINNVLTKLATPGLPLAETENERGRLAELRELLALTTPPVQIVGATNPEGVGY